MSIELNDLPKNTTCKGSTVKPKIVVSSDYLQAVKRRFILGLGLVSSLGLAIAIFQLWFSDIGWLEVGLLFFMATITGIGITVGFHRHFAHKAFNTNQAMRIILAISGSMAGQGAIVAWVSVHRCHHQYTDLDGDPHSPHLHGEGIWGRLRGLWHAHIGWLLDGKLPNSLVFAKDLIRDPVISKINQLYPLWILLGLIVPAMLGGILTRTWIGTFQGFIWGGVARLFLSFNGGYVINSIAHVYGNRNFDLGDRSTNNIWLAVPTFGEGWHNNHHAFPNSAKFGLKWWQIDLGYWAIRVLETMGLAWDVKVPAAIAIESKKSDPGGLNNGY
jgi:stearoyl-CoA desaturase (Delta-9 desaturase)